MGFTFYLRLLPPDSFLPLPWGHGCLPAPPTFFPLLFPGALPGDSWSWG